VPKPDEEIIPVTDQEKPLSEALIINDGREEQETPLPEPDALVQTQSALTTEMTPSAQDAALEDFVITAMQKLPPHEAFVYAFGEIKKTFQAEVDALKEEIRILKSTR